MTMAPPKLQFGVDLSPVVLGSPLTAGGAGLGSITYELAISYINCGNVTPGTRHICH